MSRVDLAHYFRATDLSAGFLLYPLLGAGGPIVTWAALSLAVGAGTRAEVVVPLVAASILSLAHMVTTTRAAPVMMQIGRTEDREEALAPLIERFARWSWLRTVLQACTAAALVWVLRTVAPSSVAASEILVVLLLVALGLESVLAGAGLDQIVVHLPARVKLGDAAYAAYLRAADLRRGRRLDPVLGVGNLAALLVLLAATVLVPLPFAPESLIVGAAVAGVGAFLATRSAMSAARVLVSMPPSPSYKDALDRFVRSARWRAPLLVFAFACLLVVLVA
ncbi:MAG TPA: hypothetical protein VEY12_04675 [Thermoplasmata archaeon]|nr:hypothetical protein [Thermoplasmata archaeon]